MEFEVTPDGVDFYDIKINKTDMTRIITLADTLSKKVIERITPYHYIRVITNIIHIVECHFYRKKTHDYDKISLVVSIIHCFPELNDLQDVHYSIVEEMYMLMTNDRLKKIKTLYNAQNNCCIIV